MKNTKSKPKVLVLAGYGINCEEETKFVFELAGGRADVVHINDLIAKPEMMKNYQIMAFPGGFSYGDDTGSGKAFANKFRNHLQKELDEFIKCDTLIIGICNGFQIITALGIVPGALAHNKSAQYIDRWVDLEVAGGGLSPWLAGIKKISLPIAHGEGRYIIDSAQYKVMKAQGQIAFKYVEGDICKYQNLEANPNGAMHDIAGVTANDGRILGLMPHPERAIFTHHSPLWQMKKEEAKRKNKTLDKYGNSLTLFKNAINYFSK